MQRRVPALSSSSLVGVWLSTGCLNPKSLHASNPGPLPHQRSLDDVALSQLLWMLGAERRRGGGALPNRVHHLPYFTHLITYPTETHTYMCMSETRRDAAGGVRAFGGVSPLPDVLWRKWILTVGQRCIQGSRSHWQRYAKCGWWYGDEWWGSQMHLSSLIGATDDIFLLLNLQIISFVVIDHRIGVLWLQMFGDWLVSDI